MTQFPKDSANRAEILIFMGDVNTPDEIDDVMTSGWIDAVSGSNITVPYLQRVSLYNTFCAVVFIDEDFSGTVLSTLGVAKRDAINNGAFAFLVWHVELDTSQSADLRYSELVSQLPLHRVFIRSDEIQTDRAWSRKWMWNIDGNHVPGAPTRHLWNPSHESLGDIITHTRDTNHPVAAVIQWVGEKIGNLSTQPLSWPPAMHLLYQMNDAWGLGVDSITINSYNTISGGPVTDDSSAWQNLLNMVDSFRSLVLPISDAESTSYMIRHVDSIASSDDLFSWRMGDFSVAEWNAFVAGSSFTTTVNGRRQSTSNSQGLPFTPQGTGLGIVAPGHLAPSIESDGRLKCYAPVPRVNAHSMLGVNHPGFIGDLYLPANTDLVAELFADYASESRWDLTNWCIVWQLWQTSPRNPPIAIEIRHGRWRLVIRYHTTQDVDGVELNDWEDEVTVDAGLFDARQQTIRVEFHKDHRHPANGGLGFVKFYVDDALRATYSGAIGCEHVVSSQNVAGAPYWGVYFDDTVGASEPPDDPVVYLRAISVGNVTTGSAVVANDTTVAAEEDVPAVVNVLAVAGNENTPAGSQITYLDESRLEESKVSINQSTGEVTVTPSRDDTGIDVPVRLRITNTSSGLSDDMTLTASVQMKPIKLFIGGVFDPADFSRIISPGGGNMGLSDVSDDPLTVGFHRFGFDVDWVNACAAIGRPMRVSISGSNTTNWPDTYDAPPSFPTLNSTTINQLNGLSTTARDLINDFVVESAIQGSSPDSHKDSLTEFYNNILTNVPWLKGKLGAYQANPAHRTKTGDNYLRRLNYDVLTYGDYLFSQSDMISGLRMRRRNGHSFVAPASLQSHILNTPGHTNYESGGSGRKGHGWMVMGNKNMINRSTPTDNFYTDRRPLFPISYSDALHHLNLFHRMGMASISFFSWDQGIFANFLTNDDSNTGLSTALDDNPDQWNGIILALRSYVGEKDTLIAADHNSYTPDWIYSHGALG